MSARHTAGTDLALYEGVAPTELKLCQDAIADLEHLLYEMWENDNTLTKDAARRFLQIASIFGWDMPWIEEMRECAK